MKKHIPFFVLLTMGLAFSVAPNFINQSNLIKADAVGYDPTSGAKYYSDPERYYQGIDPSLTGEELMVALARLNDETRLGHAYRDLPDIYQYSDVTESGKMRLAYTGTEKSFTPGSMPGGCNKEHVWAASWYGPDGERLDDPGTPGADAHNVWPCATDLNSKRGSCAFDELDPETSFRCYELGRSDYSYGNENDPDSWVYSTRGEFANGQNFDALYPSKGHRGETARCMLYVATSYRLHTKVTPRLYDEPKMNSDGRCGKLSTLLKWHFEELPTEWEMKRNQEIATRWHHNRNPFIDHPEYAAKIYAYLPEPGSDKPTQAVTDVINQYGNLNFADPESIVIKNQNISMAKGEKVKIEANVLPAEARQAFNFSSSNTAIANVNSTGIITAMGKGECSIKVSVRENPEINSVVNVFVKDINEIKITGTPKKLIYQEGDRFDPDGLTVTGVFSDNSTSIISNDSCVWTDNMTGNATLSIGSDTIKCTYAGKTALVSGITVNERVTNGYERVNGVMNDYSGNYLIVNEDSKVMLNGDAGEYKKGNSSIQSSVEIKDNKIKGDYDHIDFSISKSGDAYKITSSSNLTIGAKSSGDLSSGDYVNDIDFHDGEIEIKCGNLTLRYNSGYFRYYDKSNVGNPVALYKNTNSMPTDPDVPNPPDTDYEKMAKEYADQFNAAHVCGSDDNTKAIPERFIIQLDKFLELPMEAQEILINGKADKDGNSIEQCLARYDRIIFLHSDEPEFYPDFMHRKGSHQFRGFDEVKDNKVETNVMLILILGSLGLVSIGVTATLFIILKNKNSKTK